MSPPTTTAVVKWYEESKGFGFAACDDGSQDVFIHRTVAKAAGIDLQAGDRIEIESKVTPKGRQAVSVRLVP